MLNPFEIKKPVGASYALDEDDVLKTKKALSDLGHYKKPKSGATPWPDSKMFKGLKSLQKKEGLKVDGLMKPKGPTEKAIKKKTSALGIAEGEWDWMRDGKRKKEKKARQQPWPEIPRPSLLEERDKTERSPLAKNLDIGTALTTKPKPATGEDAKEAQVAAIQGLAPLLMAAGLLGVGAAGEHARKETENLLRKKQGTVPPLMPPKPEAPLPPSEPSNIPESEIKSQGRPVTPPRMPGKLENIPVQAEPSIEIYPIPDVPLWDGIQERNESEATKKQIDALRDREREKYPDWNHEGGGRNKKDGKQKKEYRIPGPGHAFPLPGRKTGDGRKLSAFADLTLISPDERHFRHYQTVDVDRNGNPTRRELLNAERIRRALHGRKNTVGEYEYHEIILVPKSWQMPKGR